ncbi:hypothetical protein [Paenibacillus dendrobii]|uniref:hypothetical protein n=1 Tax=Paenibacillus dendrobii TaxID=2691084 RepID=UPI001F3B9478|nr:hypothetical protein [Paenibacillus dendrobii]
MRKPKQIDTRMARYLRTMCFSHSLDRQTALSLLRQSIWLSGLSAEGGAAPVFCVESQRRAVQ